MHGREKRALATAILGVVTAYLTTLALPQPASPEVHPDEVTTVPAPPRTVAV